MQAPSSTPKKKAVDRGQNIQVFVRVRPLNSSEKAQRSCAIVDTPTVREVVVKEKPTSSLTRTFNFDRVFGTESQQVEVYKAVVGPLISQVLQGYNCTVFAYGQTGTGKTYTMEGLGEIRGNWDNDPEAGIIPRSLSELFDGLRRSDVTEFSVRVSFLELYNEEIFDLLSGNDDQSKLRLYEDGSKRGSVIIQGLEEVQVHNKHEVMKILEKGSIKRQTAETKMNANSSRSHTVFTVTVFMNQQSIEGDDMLKIGKLNLVDLAGSENIGRSGAVDKRAREAGNINQSLLTLGRVITALVDRAPHIPYRESKLTRLLQDSLGGRTKTSIIATISPASINMEETLSTLDYAHRAKNITNKPEVNQKISKKEKLLEYHKEIDRLKLELQSARDKDGVFLPKDTYDEQVKLRDRQEEEILALTKELKAKETELESFTEVFLETKAKLEQTTEERNKTQRALDCTRSVLHKTEIEKKEQTYLVQRHIDTECKLESQAELLLTVSDEATKDLSRLHDKLDRQRSIDASNKMTSESFQHDFSGRYRQMESMVDSHVDAQTKFCTDLRHELDENLTKRNQEKTELSSSYAETVSKLVETMSEIEKRATDNMHKEQTWVEQLLKRMRNEADTQSQSFHMYLVEKLLGVSNSVLAAMKNQEQTVNSLSTKIDKTMETLNSRLDKFIADQDMMHKARAQEELPIFQSIDQNAQQLRSAFKLDLAAAEEYQKKSKAFTEQMMAMIKARQEEEDKYLAAYNASLGSSAEMATVISEASSKAQVSRIASRAESDKITNELSASQKVESSKLLHEKAKAIDQMQADSSIVCQAAERIKADAEAFVVAGKDAWNSHYQKTETDLRAKSDDSSRHVKGVQRHTSEARTLLLGAQSSMEGMLESQRQEEESQASSQQEGLSARCQDLSDFSSVVSEQIRSMELAVQTFVGKDLKLDKPTGKTPARVDRPFPKKLVQGTPDEERLRKFRSTYDYAAGAKLDMDGIAEDDSDSVFSAVSTPAGEGSAKMSRQNSGEVFKKTSVAASNAGVLKPSNSAWQRSGSSLSSATADSLETGYISDEANDQKENFAKPRSKLRQPGSYRSRSGSRNRTAPKQQV